MQSLSNSNSAPLKILPCLRLLNQFIPETMKSICSVNSIASMQLYKKERNLFHT
eukprot:UN20874